MDYQQELSKLDYKNVLKYFLELSLVPRGSGYNEKISNYLVDFAKKNNLNYKTDEAYNVIIYKNASKGYENLPAVVIQGHMDMVCVKEANSNHDFLNEGLDLFIDGDKLGAKDTTLGADDGIALAYGLALLSDESLLHPAIEFVATTDEETGLFGAKAINPEWISGKYMINVDSEEEDFVLRSCAGGLRITGFIDLNKVKSQGTKVEITIDGLQGGHSGSDIHKNRTNAVILLGRILNELNNIFNLSLISLDGGEKDNAIPNRGVASIVVKNNDINEFLLNFEKLCDSLKSELSASEKDLTISLKKLEEGEFDCLAKDCFDKVLFVLNVCPNGVQVMSSEIENLVESSINLGIFETNNEEIVIHFSARSSKSSYKYYLKEKVFTIFKQIGARFESGSDYPAWEYKANSYLSELYAKAFKKATNKDIIFKAIHAGLECGIFNEKLPELDIISIGPEMRDIHTTKERLFIDSAIRVYQTIENLLENMLS